MSNTMHLLEHLLIVYRYFNTFDLYLLIVRYLLF